MSVKLPSVKIRQHIYKAATVLIPLVTLLGYYNIVPVAVAGAVATLLGFLSSGLADRATTQQQKDGTLILTGSVQEQVNKGTDILINEAVDAIEGLSQVGNKLDRLKDARDQAVIGAGGIPVLGPLAKEALDRLI